MVNGSGVEELRQLSINNEHLTIVILKNNGNEIQDTKHRIRN